MSVDERRPSVIMVAGFSASNVVNSEKAANHNRKQNGE